MTDLENAKTALKGNVTVALCCGEETIVSEKRGIAPMLGFIADKTDLKGFSAADRIVGKAAALLFAFAGIKAVYAEVLSEGGAEVLKKYGIVYSYGALCKNIVNRTGDGICPMEMTVKDIDLPQDAYVALAAKVAELRGGGAK